MTAPRLHRDNRKPRHRHPWALAALLALALASGCSDNERTVAMQAPTDKAYVMLLPGVEGGGWQFTWTLQGL